MHQSAAAFDAQQGTPRRVPRLLWLGAVLLLTALLLPSSLRAEDGAPKESPPKDSSPKDSPPKDSPPKDSPPNDNPDADTEEDTEAAAEAEEERLEAVDRHTERALKAWRTGNHDEVFARMARLRTLDPTGTLAPYLTARTYLRTGQYDECRKLLTQARLTHPNEARLTHVLYDLHLVLSEHDALAALAAQATEATPNDPVAWVYLGRAREARGQRDQALKAYDQVIELHNSRKLDKQAGPWIARAAVAATWLSPLGGDDMIDSAHRILQRYMRANPDDMDAQFGMAQFFRADRGSRGQSRASKALRSIIRENSEHVGARIERARIALVFYKQSDALSELGRARKVNPRHPEALAVEAAIHVGNGYYERAAKLLDKVAEVAPNDRYMRAVRGALLWIRGDKDGHKAERDAVLAYDPTYSEFDRTCAELVGERQRRFDISADFARKAIEVDKTDRVAYAVLGEALMNLGQTDEALEQFELGAKVGKRRSDVHSDNWRDLLKNVMPTFRTYKTKNFVVRMPRSEARVMEHYLLPLLEESKTVLEKNYGFKIATPIYVDAFDIDQDFSVRSIGTPGLPALGVCFGRVITLLGPTSKPMGAFSWSRTTWHEFAHVVTLQQSQGQVPRWLTEGLSVFEEQRRKDIWGRDMQLDLFNRYHNDSLLRMSKINAAFRGGDIMFAYYQGGLIAEHLTKERGFEVIPKMLEAFAKDRTTEQVFKEVLSLELAAYDQQFRDYAKLLVEDYKFVPRWDSKNMKSFRARTKKDPKDVEAWIRLAWGHSQAKRVIDAGAALKKARDIQADHPEVILLIARMDQKAGRGAAAEAGYLRYIATGNDDFLARQFLAKRSAKNDTDPTKAIEHWQAAAECFPPYQSEKDNPYLELAALYRGQGKIDESVKQFEAFARVAPRHIKVRKQLRSWYVEKEDWVSLARVCEEVIDVSPFGADMKGQRASGPDMELHRQYAQALKALDKSDLELRERRVQAELGHLLPEKDQQKSGVVNDLIALGQLLFDRGNYDEALEQAVAALRVDPDDAKARILKARSMEEGDAR